MLTPMIRRVRQNHALEHATVSLLLKSGYRPPLGGYSTPGGFFIFGRCSLDAITDAVSEGYGRLTTGESELAVSPYCGTNLLTGAVLSGVASALVIGFKGPRKVRIPLAIAAALGVAVISRPLGNRIQKNITTLGNLNDLTVVDIRRLWERPYPTYRVRTAALQVGARDTMDSRTE